MARKMPKLNKEILQKISDLVPRQYLGFWEVSLLVLWHDPKLHSFSGIKSQSTWPGQALSTSTMCNHIWRDTPMYNFYMYMLRFTYLYTLIQISFYKSLVDDSITNSKDDSRSKLPAVSDTKMLQEHFERCYSSVQWQSGMRPIKQSDAMPWCCILRHWLRADFQEDREDIEWNNQTYFGCKGIHFMDFLLSSNIWHEMIWYDMMCYDMYIYIYTYLLVKYSSCVPICVLYIFSSLSEGHTYQFPSSDRWRACEERLKHDMGSVFAKKRLLDAVIFSPLMWRSSLLTVELSCIMVYSDVFDLSLLLSWCFSIPEPSIDPLKGPVWVLPWRNWVVSHYTDAQNKMEWNSWNSPLHLHFLPFPESNWQEVRIQGKKPTTPERPPNVSCQEINVLAYISWWTQIFWPLCRYKPFLAMIWVNHTRHKPRE